MNTRIIALTWLVAMASLLLPSASAAVIRFTPAGGDYTVTTTSSSVTYWLKTSGSLTTTTPSGTEFAFGLQYQGANLAYVGLWNASVASRSRIPGYDNLSTNFVAGDLIDGADFIRSGASWLKYTTNGEFVADTAGYMGFSFFNTAGDNKVHYGWANVTLLAGGAGFTVHDWAYETTGDTAIAAGSLVSVPETSPALLCVPLFAVAMLRALRRREDGKSAV